MYSVRRSFTRNDSRIMSKVICLFYIVCKVQVILLLPLSTCILICTNKSNTGLNECGTIKRLENNTINDKQCNERMRTHCIRFGF